MWRNLVGGLMAAVLCAGGSTAAAGVTGLVVTGGSLLANASLETDPAAVSLTTLSLEPSVLTFSKDPGEMTLAMTLFQINAAGVMWDGLDYALVGGVFAADPVPTFGGLPGMRDGGDASRAELFLGVPSGTTLFVDLQIDFGAGTSAVLTVTPIVPEPAAGGILGVTTLLLRCRRGGG